MNLFDLRNRALGFGPDPRFQGDTACGTQAGGLGQPGPGTEFSRYSENKKCTYDNASCNAFAMY